MLVSGLSALIIEIFLIAAVLSRQIATPLQQLTEASQQWANGNFEIRLNASRQDELGDLAGSFNSMAGQLKTSFDQLETVNAALADRVGELQKTVSVLHQTQAQMVQSEKMSSLGQLVAGIAHEINNPVSFIYGNINYVEAYFHSLLSLIGHYQNHYPNPALAITKTIDAIELDFLQEDLPKLLESMRRGTERIKKIVLSLRNFARMDESEYKAVDLHEGIKSTLMILENRLKAQAHRLTIEIIREYENLPLVKFYAGQLNQVFINILVNAIDAFDEQKQNVNLLENQQNFIRIITSAEDHKYVTIRFIDNGSGIAEADQKRLFDPFFTTKPVGKGTGMGLAIAYQTVTERHGGTLECKSSVGQGAEFIIKIPLQR